MTLRLLLRLLATLVVSVVGLLVVRVAWIAAVDVERAAQARQAVVRLREALVVAEMVARERSPTNALLAEELPVRPERLQALAEARARTDTAWTALAARLHGDAPVQGEAVRRTDEAQRVLQAARAEFDRVLALPKSDRDPELLRATVLGLVAVVPRLTPVVDGFAAEAQAALPALGEDVQGARLAAELRENAGLLGAHFAAPMARRVSFDLDERLQVERTRGRIDQLRVLLELRVQGPERAAAVAQHWAQVEQRFFGVAMALADTVIAQGERDGAYDMEVADFVAFFVPDVNTILDLRDTLLDLAAQAAQDESARAWRALAAMSLVTVLVGAALIAAVRVLRRRVLQPLAATVKVLDDLARDEPGGALPEPPADDEIAAVIRGVGTLQAHARARHALERERDELIERLKSQSATDFLTGLANRRAFFSSAERELAGARRHGVPVVVVVLDIDHFKRLNDAHGHDRGDEALRVVADAVRSELRQDDLAARHGGEEFVLLLRHCGRDDGLRFAERLRKAIAEAPVRLSGDLTLHVTASVGVASSSDHGHDLAALVNQADQAMYRAKHAGRNRVALAPPPEPELPAELPAALPAALPAP